MRAIATQSPRLMPAPDQRRRFRQQLLRWFDGNRRELPWRADRDPYHVWISEIMLQQTRVAVVRDRYADFLRRFSSVERLAAESCPRCSRPGAAWDTTGARVRCTPPPSTSSKTASDFPEPRRNWRRS